MSQQIFRDIDRGHLLAVRRELAINPQCLQATVPSDGQTPLHRAAVLGHVDVVRELLRYNARYDIADKFGNTPLHLACQSGELDAVLPLLSPGMRHTLKWRNNDGQTPLHIAVMIGTKEIVRALVEAGARVDTKDKDGHAAHDLITESQTDLIQALTIDAAASPSERVSPEVKVRSISPMTPTSLRKGSMNYDKKIESTKGKRMKHLSSSPEKGHMHYNDVTQRTLPRKQLNQHEMAIQGLQSEVQDLGFRADNMEHFLNESQEGFDRLEGLSQCVEKQDHQLAELDQRLMFQESQMRDLRPRISTVTDESRLQASRFEELVQTVEKLQDNAKNSLGTVLEKVKHWESTTLSVREETAKQSEAEKGRQSEIRELEQQILSIQNLITEAKQASNQSISIATSFEQNLVEVQDRMSVIEDSIKEATATTDDNSTEDDDDEHQQTKHQIQELFEHYTELKGSVKASMDQTSEMKEIYKEQVAFDHTRKTEQDLELSKREAKILELREIALEEENQRRDFGRIQEENLQKIDGFEKTVADAISQAKTEAKERTELQEKVKMMEMEISNLYERLEENEEKIKKGRCCVIN